MKKTIDRDLPAKRNYFATLKRFLYAIIFSHVMLDADIAHTKNLRREFKNSSYELVYERTDKVQKVFLKGRLTNYFDVGEGFNALFSKLLLKTTPIEIYLHWAGGDELAHDWVHQQFKKYPQITTIVEKDKSCASACIALFMVGKKRIVHPTSRFGFHCSSIPTPFGPMKVFGGYDYELKYGVDRKWLQKNAEVFESVKIKYFTPNLLIGSKVFTEIQK